MQIILPSATYSKDSWGNIDDTMEAEWEAIETYLTDANSESKLNQKLNQFIKYLKGNNDFGLNFWDKVDCFYIPGIFSSADYLGMNIKTGKFDDCVLTNTYWDFGGYDSTDKVLTFENKGTGSTASQAYTGFTSIAVGPVSTDIDISKKEWELFSFTQDDDLYDIAVKGLLAIRWGVGTTSRFHSGLHSTTSYSPSIYNSRSSHNYRYSFNISGNKINYQSGYGGVAFFNQMPTEFDLNSDDLIVLNLKPKNATITGIGSSWETGLQVNNSKTLHGLALVNRQPNSITLWDYDTVDVKIGKHFYLSAVDSTLTEEQWTDLNEHAQEVIDLL